MSQADCFAKLIDHALRFGVAKLLKLRLKLLENGLVQRHRPARSSAWAVKIEYLGLAELGALGRNQGHVFSCGGNVAVRRPSRRGFVSGRSANLAQRRGQQTAAFGHFEDRFLSGLHLVGIAELARRLFGVRGLVANDQGLRSFPGVVMGECVYADNRGDRRGRHEPEPNVGSQQR